MPRYADYKGLGLLTFPDDWSDEQIHADIKANEPKIKAMILDGMRKKAEYDTLRKDRVAMARGEYSPYTKLGSATAGAIQAGAEQVASGLEYVGRAAETVGPRALLAGDIPMDWDPEVSARLDADRAKRAAETPAEKEARIEGNRLVQAGKAVRAATEKAVPTIPAVAETFWYGKVPAGVGTMAGQVAVNATMGPAVGIGTMFTAEANNAWDQEIARQKAAGEPYNPDKALLKTFGYGTFASAVEYKFGAGRVTRILKDAFGGTAKEATKKALKTGRFMPFMGAVLKDAGVGAGEEATQQLGQDIIVTGEPNIANAIEAAKVGAVVQGGVAAPGRAVQVAEESRKARLAAAAGPMPASEQVVEALESGETKDLTIADLNALQQFAEAPLAERAVDNPLARDIEILAPTETITADEAARQGTPPAAPTPQPGEAGGVVAPTATSTQGEPDAVQVQEPNAGVLRQEGPPVELQRVGQENAQPEVPPGTQAEEEGVAKIDEKRWEHDSTLTLSPDGEWVRHVGSEEIDRGGAIEDILAGWHESNAGYHTRVVRVSPRKIDLFSAEPNQQEEQAADEGGTFFHEIVDQTKKANALVNEPGVPVPVEPAEAAVVGGTAPGIPVPEPVRPGPTTAETVGGPVAAEPGLPIPEGGEKTKKEQPEVLIGHEKFSPWPYAVASPDLTEKGKWRLTYFSEFTDRTKTPVGHEVFSSRELALKKAKEQDFSIFEGGEINAEEEGQKGQVLTAPTAPAPTAPEPARLRVGLGELGKAEGAYDPLTDKVTLDRESAAKLSRAERARLVRHELAHRIDTNEELWKKTDSFLWRLWETDKRHPLWEYMGEQTGKAKFDNTQSAEILASLYSDGFDSGKFTVANRTEPYESEGEDISGPQSYKIPQPILTALKKIESKLGIWSKRKARSDAKSPTAPEPVSANVEKRPKSTPSIEPELKVGEKIEFFDRGQWYPATITESESMYGKRAIENRPWVVPPEHGTYHSNEKGVDVNFKPDVPGNWTLLSHQKIRKPASSKAKAADDLTAALGKLSLKFTKKAMFTPEERQEIMPILVEAFDAAIRLGYHTVKDALAHVVAKLREAGRSDIADQLTEDDAQEAINLAKANMPPETPEARAVEKTQAVPRKPGKTEQIATLQPDGKISIKGEYRLPSKATYGSTSYFGLLDRELNRIADEFIAKYGTGEEALQRAEALSGTGVDPFRDVILAKIVKANGMSLKVAGGKQDAIEASDAVFKAMERLQASKTDSAQTLAAQRAVNEILGPVKGLLTYMRLIARRQEEVVEPQLPEGLPAQLNALFKRIGAAAADLFRREGLIGPLKAVEGRITLDVPSESETGKVLNRINALFPLAEWRKFFTKKGTKDLADRFWKIMAPPRADHPGHVYTFEGVVSGELGRILNEAMAAAGFKPESKTQKLTPAERIAQFIGEDPLRSDKLRLIDEAVSKDIASRKDDVVRIQLEELWDSVMGMMASSPSSQTTAKRLVQEIVKAQKVDWKTLNESTPAATAAMRQQVVDAAAAQVQAAATNPLKLDDLKTLVGSVFDQIAAVRRQRYEAGLLAKRAREAYRLTITPELQAQGVVDQFAKTQTDTPAFPKGKTNDVKAAVAAHMNGESTAEELIGNLVDLGVSRPTAEKVAGVAERELAIQRIAEWYKERDRVAKTINDDAEISRLLRKAGREVNMDLSDLFFLPHETQRKNQIALLDRVRSDPRFANLTPQETVDLTNALFRRWNWARLEVLKRELKQVLARTEATPAVKEKVEKSLPRLVKYLNMGALNNAKFRDAVAPEFGVPAFSEATVKELGRLAQEAQAAKGEAAQNRIYEQMIQTMLKGNINPFDLARDVWYANVLSGLRTWVDVGIGSWVSGLTMTLRAAADTATVMKSPRAAARMVGEFFTATGEALASGVDMVRTGDYSRLPDRQEHLAATLEGKGRPDSLELAKRSDKAWQKALGQLSYVRRMMIALDYVGALGTRDAMLMYVAMSRGDAEAMAAAQKRYDAKETARAEKQAQDELGPGAKAVDVRARKREILEQGISKEVRDGATTLGKVAALNAEPVGWGGWVYRNMISRLHWLARSALGLGFARAAINMVQNASDWMPIVGFANYARARGTESGWFPKNSPLSVFSLDVPPERRRLILSAQIASLGIGLTAIGMFLDNDDDEEDRLFDISGTWSGLPYTKRGQLQSQGEKPLSIRIGDKWISFKNTPFAGILAFVGNMRDKQRFFGTKFNEMDSLYQFVDAWVMIAGYIKDISALSQLAQIFNVSAVNSTDEVGDANKWAARIIGNWSAGFIPAASLMREVDTMQDPSVYRAGKGVEYWLRNIPFARRTIGPGPAIDALGGEIQAARLPWGRYLSDVPADPAWETLAGLASKGAFVPIPSKTATIVGRDHKRRQMNEDEYYQYQQAVGLAWRRAIEGNMDRLKAASPEEAQKWFADRVDRLHQNARAKVRATE